MQRLGRNHGGYQGETVEIRAILDEIRAAAKKSGWSLHTFHVASGFEWLALNRGATAAPDRAPKRRVYISAGIHGDEPAGPLAMRELLRQNVWPDDLDVTLVPCLNPVGFTRNQRENELGSDLNRDYLNSQTPEIRAHIGWLERQAPFQLCLCLHEDWEAHGFYVYELNPDEKASLAEAMITAAAQVCPIDPAAIIEGREAQGGIIRPNLDPRTRPQWPESFWLLQHRTRLSYTLEAPSDFALPVRVSALTRAVQCALSHPLLS